ncbi:MAG: hypothetical protein ACREPR_19535 [Brasilonema sp.]
MQLRLLYSTQAKETLVYLEKFDYKKYQKILKTLALMEINLRHPSLNTHKYNVLSGPNGEEVFEAYVESKTPAAFRIFWYYGTKQGELTILAITPHP